MKETTIFGMLEAIVGIIGFIFVWQFDWRLAIGAFFLMYAQNIRNSHLSPTE